MSDLIDRQDAIYALRTHERKASKKWFDNQLDIEWNNAIDICCYDIEDLPSAQPERKRGRWIDDGDPFMWECGCCGYRVKRYNNTRYCPNCGADMREVSE